MVIPEINPAPPPRGVIAVDKAGNYDTTGVNRLDNGYGFVAP